ncbi:hypothetical protein [Hyphomicrobium sp.]|uniref:hypothetical protein n=1 Tax=Hyphomicrobium sp. TaxID=82 RepID=UPI0025BA2DED|nr:hypothetical protein [Hyphomicrobium sp.]MCC7253985.1 hypothetical protein [Hyphomicrobium sp.]
MRLTLGSIAIVLGSLAAGPALADCSTEVALAVNSQGKQKFIRKETNMITEAGPAKMVVEYATPDRMRQVLTPLTEGKAVESIVVGEKAWTNNGEGWKEAPSGEADQLVQYMIRSIAQVYQEVGKFECIGTETVEGRELRGYRGIDEPPPGVPGKKTEPTTKNEAVRLVYLDPKTGLPARSLLARPGYLDKPIFQEIYTYPDKIDIEPPKDVKK